MAKKSKQYAWQQAHAIINAFIDNVNSGMLNMAWVKAQFLIEAQAKYHVYTGHDESDALAMAWEDFDMACRGKADPAITSPAFMLWAYVPGRTEKQWMRTLKDAFKAAGITIPYPQRDLHIKSMPGAVPGLTQDDRNG